MGLSSSTGGMSANAGTASSQKQSGAGGFLASQGLSLGVVLRDRLTVLGIVWALLAFVLRPMLEAAHFGRGGPLAGYYQAVDNPLGFALMLGFAQWLSVALLVVLVAMAHVRISLSSSAESARAVRERWAVFPLVYVGVLIFGYLAFFWTPTTTFTHTTHDSFIFFDASYRILNGETPHVDFPTVLGAAALYLPAFGAWLAGGYAGSIELASVPIALMAGLAVARAGVGRYPSGVTCALVVVAFLIAVPASLIGLMPGSSHTFVGGEPVVLSEGLSHAMFYNRWGWAVLIPMFAFLAPRVAEAAPSDDDRGWLIDTLVMAALVALLFYVKASFFAVGCASAVLFAFLNEKPMRTLAVGVGVSLAIVLGVGLLGGFLGAYLQELWKVVQISGGKSNTFLEIVRQNVVFFLVAMMPLGALAAEGRFTRQDAIVGAFMILMSLFVIVQNAQLFDIVTLCVLAGYGVARYWSATTTKAGRFVVVAAFAITSLVYVFERGIALVDQAVATRREEVREPSKWADIPALRGVYVAEREDGFARLQEAETDIELLEAFHFVNRVGRKESMRQGEYMTAVLSGIAELEKVIRPGDSVVTLDMNNPFPFLMNTRSAKGSYITMDGDRTVSEEIHPDPSVLFADTDHVMIPKAAMLQHTIELVNELYDKWLTENYEQREETVYWVRYSFRRSDVPASALNLRQ